MVQYVHWHPAGPHMLTRLRAPHNTPPHPHTHMHMRMRTHPHAHIPIACSVQAHIIAYKGGACLVLARTHAGARLHALWSRT